MFTLIYLMKIFNARKPLILYFYILRNSTIHSFMIYSKTKIYNWFPFFFNRPEFNASRTDIMNDDQNSYTFAPTYRDESTDYHRHLI